jgi:hypothetical protein
LRSHFIERLALCVILSMTAASAAERHLSTDALSCSQLNNGASRTSKTDMISNPRKSMDAYASITLSSSATAVCTASYNLVVSERSGGFKPVKTLSVELHDNAGIDLLGFSPDGSKLAADFWWSVGDYRRHRPVVYEVKSHIARITELGDQVTSQLPACGYIENLTGITNAGEIELHVPRNATGTDCPDQGNWLFDPKSGEASRAK